MDVEVKVSQVVALTHKILFVQDSLLNCKTTGIIIIIALHYNFTLCFVFHKDMETVNNSVKQLKILLSLLGKNAPIIPNKTYDIMITFECYSKTG